MSKRFQQRCALDGDLHSAHPREEKGGLRVALATDLRKSGREMTPKTFDAQPQAVGKEALQKPRSRNPAHSCNCRFSSSISSASVLSVLTRLSIFRTACRTVVWSRPPNRRPISGSERSVSALARYIAT
jgi:hypothetical protein